MAGNSERGLLTVSNPNKDKPALGRGARLVAGCAYPAVMAMAVTLHASLAWMGLSPPLAAYAAGLLAALLITWHEIRLPYRQSWKPRRPEVANDLLFLITVQVALPLLLAVSLVSVLAQYLVAHGIVLGTVWPHHLPVWFQVVLMLLIADFGRYWLHRAFHKFGLMWRFHAVHHSPRRLYWLNVGRFHPIEKAFQYVFDALPFTLVGVSGDVLAGYFTFYAVNGFYQHSNCLVWLGRLNYVISGPELHRWHHSMLARESDRNFGNNLIVWDLLFGTRFLPDDRDVGPLGLVDQQYPAGFLAQMGTPFGLGLAGK